jgi:thioredoxin reductase (NADPH)
MYPEKAIFDVAGFPAIRGRELVDQLVKQAAPFSPSYWLGHQAVGLERGDGKFAVTTSVGERIECRAIVITGGIGTFTPRPLPVGQEYLGRGLVHFVPDPAAYEGQHVVVVGGRDSAVDRQSRAACSPSSPPAAPRRRASPATSCSRSRTA